MDKRLVSKAIIIGILLVAGLSLFVFPQVQQQSSALRVTPSVTVTDNSTITNFTYEGKEGMDALSLLRKQTSVEQDDSGMVTSINGRKADGTKREYWAFYVNGTMAPVGAHEYVTKDTDKVEWKIETY